MYTLILKPEIKKCFEFILMNYYLMFDDNGFLFHTRKSNDIKLVSILSITL